MKNFQSILFFIAGAVSLSAGAANYTFVAGDNRVETQLCIAAAENDLPKYRRTIKRVVNYSPMKVRSHKVVANRLDCNNQNIVMFARKYGANDTVSFITRYLKRSVSVKQDIADTIAPIDNESHETKVIIVTSK